MDLESFEDEIFRYRLIPKKDSKIANGRKAVEFYLRNLGYDPLFDSKGNAYITVNKALTRPRRKNLSTMFDKIEYIPKKEISVS